MATFSRDWNESVPTDNTFAVDIDDYNRYLRVDVSDRLKAMIYGFTAGENDGKPGFKKLTFKQQDSAPSSPNADEIVLYAIDDGSNCGLYAKNEDGYIKQILKKSGSSLLLNIGDSEGCVMKTGTQTIAGAKTFSDDVTLNGTNTLASLIASANLDIGDYTFTAKQLIADVATGTAPLTVSSTTKVSNLNADKVDGKDAADLARIKIGTYFGDGNSTQEITGVGFEPDAVFVFPHAGGAAYTECWVKTSGMGTYAKEFKEHSNWWEDIIISLDEDGFTVGDGGSNVLNTSGRTYSYIAIRSAQ